MSPRFASRGVGKKTSLNIFALSLSSMTSRWVSRYYITSVALIDCISLILTYLAIFYSPSGDLAAVSTYFLCLSHSAFLMILAL